MCLDVVYNEPAPKGIIEAWKCFIVKPGGRLEGRYQGGEFPRDRWLKADTKGRDIESSHGEFYAPGFHAFNNLPPSHIMAHNNKTVIWLKVKLKNVKTMGSQDNLLAFVATQMFIPRTRNGRKECQIQSVDL